MTDRELMQMALDAFEKIVDGCQNVKKANPMHESARDLATFVIVDCKAPIKSISARLAQPEPEPVAYLCENAVGHKYFRWKKPPSTYKPIALYTAPPQREWVGLTREELVEIAEFHFHGALSGREFYDDVEAKLKEKNG